MSAHGEETSEASGSGEQPAPATEPPKRGPGRPRKPQQVSAFSFLLNNFMLFVVLMHFYNIGAGTVFFVKYITGSFY